MRPWLADLRRLASLAASAGLLAVAGGGMAAAARPPDAPLAPASPDWRDQVIYFVMIDRFSDGDPGNDDQGAGEFDPADGAKYSGGDLRGITARLDYIRGLGATTVWITPPVANQWWNVKGHFSGYHGYWAENFDQVDAHYGTLADYKALAEALHGNGMYLVQDIVLNHTADFFAYAGGWDARDPARHFVRHADSRGRTAPSQAPFDQNDARDPAQRRKAIYHWTPDIADFNDRHQVLDYQLAGLDDINTENPRVRHALRASYGDWIRKVGVDGFRVDTAFHVPADFFADFLHADDPSAPGIDRVARATGRAGFLSFGEGFGTDKPYADAQARKLDAYMRTPGGLPSMINFPLYGSLGDVFARGRPTAELGYRIRDMMAVHADPWRMPSFVDNHDVDRFLAGGSQAGLQQALLAMLTLPGIPTIYYGTEQGFTSQRAAMFAHGFGAGGHDHFDTAAPLYRFLREAIALRRDHRVFSRGTPRVLSENAAGPGGFAYRVDGEGDTALVAFNTADGASLLDNIATGLPPGSVLHRLFGIDDGLPDDVMVGASGRLTLSLPSRSAIVWQVMQRTAALPPARAQPTLEPLQSTPFVGDFAVVGTTASADGVRVVVDGDLEHAQSIRTDGAGRWHAMVRTGGMIDPGIVHRVVALDPHTGDVSDARTFHVAHAWRVVADVDDRHGDDNGPTGQYVYPADPGWRLHRPADITHVRASTAGGALRVALRMHDVVSQWNPTHGFDHVALTVFVQLPGEPGGSRTMPLQHATLPGGMRWHYRLRANGWSLAAFSATAASDDNEGTPAASPDIAVDKASDTITFTIPATALGDRASLAGAELYVTSWDYDGGYRALAPRPKPATFGGGGARDPLVMDATDVIVLR
ncbi:alpha-amylase family glycosyl hydrolase [Cognatiluteimonas profundi]|uniref:alpha-amylase family glycosyl hydrolase n=1 Tax=Cognatiluteimonas profundi TaxID=2594501 RepID=UPI00131BD618|nr:alpha-amylase family glycosyl hydrolase [Lysobacter profundi]